MQQLNSNQFFRQLDILPPEKLCMPILIIGAGAIGSATALTLAKMGCSSITIYDDDTIEEHNVSNQMCRLDRIGTAKVTALAELVKDLTGVIIGPIEQKYIDQSLKGYEIIIVTVDSMAARKTIWDATIESSANLFIDARMGAEFARIYALDPFVRNESKAYSDTLYTDENAINLPCSAQSIIYCPTIIGGMIASIVKSYIVSGINKISNEVLFDIRNFFLMSSRFDEKKEPGKENEEFNQKVYSMEDVDTKGIEIIARIDSIVEDVNNG